MSSQTLPAAPPRPLPRDPTRVTEFASPEYFQKIQQLEQARQQQHATEAAGSSLSPALTVQQSPFILPLRESKPVEIEPQPAPEPKQKKSRFGLSRLLLHKQTQQAAPDVPPQEPKRLSFGEVAKPRIVPFDELFFTLPAELQIQVIQSLPLSDILNLRTASRSLHAMVTANEGPIVRYHLDHHVPAYAKRLYPAPDPTNLDFHYLCGLWHRLHVAAKLSVFICEWTTKEIFLKTTEQQKAEFATQRERMRRRLIPLLFTIFHFFETYRDRHLQYMRDHGGKGLLQTPYTLNPIEAEIMAMYDDRTLLQVHQVFPLVIASFCRRLRPPSYIGRTERAFRGYLREKPADEVHTATLVVGGLRQVERFWMINGYNTRRGAVDVWYNSIAHGVTESSAPKPKRGLMGLGRKKSTVAIRETVRPDDAASPIPALPNSFAFGVDPRRNSLVFKTSLSAGMPMGDLSQDELKLLLPDLPILQQIWVTTAEALILDRKIVERSTDVRRNAQVMMALIQEDGMIEEDEWWYGQAADSVRPSLAGMDDDNVDEAGPPT